MEDKAGTVVEEEVVDEGITTDRIMEANPAEIIVLTIVKVTTKNGIIVTSQSKFSMC